MVFDQSWFKKYQSVLLWFVNTPLGRHLFRIHSHRSSVGRRSITKITPNSISWIERQTKQKTYFTTEFRTHNKFSKRIYHTLLPLWYAFHLWDKIVNALRLPKLNLGFDTLTAYPAAGNNSPIDGYVGVASQDKTLANLLATAGSTAATTDAANNLPWLEASTTTDQFEATYVAGFCWDTSSLTAGATVSGAVLSLEGNGSRTVGLGDAINKICLFNPANTNALVNGDFNTFTYTAQSDGGFNNAQWSESAYNDFTLNATGLGNISKTGVTKFGLCFDWHIGGFTGVWANSETTRSGVKFADSDGTNEDPKLAVTYTAAASVGVRHPDTLSNESRYTKIAKSTTATFKRLSDQLVHKLGTARKTEIIKKIGDTGEPYEKRLNDYVNSL